MTVVKVSAGDNILKILTHDNNFIYIEPLKTLVYKVLKKNQAKKQKQT